MTTAQMVLAVLVPLVLWRIYRRVRRFIGRQRSRLWRHVVAATFFPLMVVMLGLVALHSTLAISGIAGGTAAGLALGLWGLTLTRYEVTPEGYFYTPSTHIGIAVSLLFVARILYRLVEIYAAGGLPGTGAQDFGRSPLTLLVFGLLAGYYTAYAMGLIRWRLTTPGHAA